MNTKLIKEYIKEEKPFNYVKMPRFIVDLEYQGTISERESALYSYMKIRSDSFNRYHANTKTISTDLFKGQVSSRTVGNMIRDMKRSELITYPDIKGKKGKYAITFNNSILMSEKQVGNTSKKNEVSLKNKGGKLSKNADNKGNPSDSYGPDMDGDKKKKEKKKKTEKEIVNIDISNSKHNPLGSNNKYSEMPPSDYKPTNYEEERLKKIATDLGEKSMFFILSNYEKGHYTQIDEAYIQTMELVKFGEVRIKSKGAYFNKILQEKVKEKEQKEQAQSNHENLKNFGEI